MKNKILFLALFIFALSLFSLFAGLACEDDDDDSSDDDNDSSSNNDDDDDIIDDDNTGDDDANSPLNPECEGTQSPLLLAVHLYVNDTEVAMPANVLTTDELKLGIEYSDVDCNLAAGHINVRINPEEPYPGYHNLFQAIPPVGFTITDEIGCSSEEAGEQYFVVLDPVHFLVPDNLNKTLPFVLVLYDVCSFCSIPTYLPLDFTVIEG